MSGRKRIDKSIFGSAAAAANRRARGRWNDYESALAQSLDQDGVSVEVIAERVGRSVDAVAAHLGKRHAAFKSKLGRGATAFTRVPQELLDARDVRLAACESRSLTQQFFGDPAPGYSALDHNESSCANDSMRKHMQAQSDEGVL